MYVLEISQEENIKYINNIIRRVELSYGDEVFSSNEEVRSWLTDFSMFVLIVCVHGKCWEKHNIREDNIEYEETQSLMSFVVDNEIHMSFMITKFMFESEKDRNLFKLTWG